VLAEGAGALVLEDWERAERRGARIYAELAGYGESCDRSNLVRPDAAGQARAMRAALADAGLAPADVDYVNAHATGTREGDTVEVAALAEVLGAHAPQVAVSATKSAHGHPLGAAGALEAVATALALHAGSVPPTLGEAQDLDPDCGGRSHVVGAARTGARLRAALSNSFAFGGSNAVLALRAAA
jgi:3-oxoacyl-[acyl-carrier-protein] synthase II